MKNINIHTSRGWKEIPVWKAVLSGFSIIVLVLFVVFQLIIPLFYFPAAAKWDAQYYNENLVSGMFMNGDTLHSSASTDDHHGVVVQEDVSKFNDKTWVKEGLKAEKDSVQYLYAYKYSNLAKKGYLSGELKRYALAYGNAYFKEADSYTCYELEGIKNDFDYLLTVCTNYDLIRRLQNM